MNEQKQEGGFGGNKNKQRFDGRGSSRPHFGGQDFKRGGSRDSGRTQFFSATCSNCHKPCEVPFRPSGGKPVYCKECFMSRRENFSRGEGREEGPSRNFQKRAAPLSSATQPYGAGMRLDDLKRQLDVVNAKLDVLLQKVGGAGPRTHAQAKEEASSVPKRAAKKSRTPSKSSKK